MPWDIEEDELPNLEGSFVEPLEFDRVEPYAGLLTKREGNVLRLLHGESRDNAQEDLARLRITPERARQIEQRALAKVRRLASEDQKYLLGEMGVDIAEFRNAADESESEIIATIYVDPNSVSPEFVSRFIKALSRGYEAIGGEPLEIRDGGTGIYENAKVPA